MGQLPTGTAQHCSERKGARSDDAMKRDRIQTGPAKDWPYGVCECPAECACDQVERRSDGQYRTHWVLRKD